MKKVILSIVASFIFVNSFATVSLVKQKTTTEVKSLATKIIDDGQWFNLGDYVDANGTCYTVWAYVEDNGDMCIDLEEKKCPQ
ncbi:MAG: hypothetical protein ACRCVT_16385 [Leadbetterella sp.]